MSFHPIRHLNIALNGALRLARDMDLLKVLGYTKDETASILFDLARAEAALPWRTTNSEHARMRQEAIERWTR
jgi:hypothetical protein